MRFLAVGDTHLGLLNGRTAHAKRELADQAAQQFRYCVNKAMRTGADWIFHAGDIFDRSRPKAWAIDQYYSIIQPALDAGINLAVIPGNHDKGVLQPSLFDFEYDNYHVINSLKYLDFDEFRLVASPYIYSNMREKERKMQAWIDNSDRPVIVLLHHLFSGASFGPMDYTFRNREDCVRLRLPDYAQVITGHVHRTQTLNGGKIVYTGSTVRTSFAEAIEPKGYLLGEITPESIMYRFVELPSIPMEVIETAVLDMEELGQKLHKLSPRTRILLRLTGMELASNQLQMLFAQFPAHRWPYFSVSPRGDRILEPLYAPFWRRHGRVQRVPHQYTPVFRQFASNELTLTETKTGLEV
ncbi:MAG: metallophosphoesterase family protein [Candidatus Kariarchaeaceae archaeon]